MFLSIHFYSLGLSNVQRLIISLYFYNFNTRKIGVTDNIAVETHSPPFKPRSNAGFLFLDI